MTDEKRLQRRQASKLYVTVDFWPDWAWIFITHISTLGVFSEYRRKYPVASATRLVGRLKDAGYSDITSQSIFKDWTDIIKLERVRYHD